MSNATERELGQFVRHHLNQGVSCLDKPTSDRLFAARQTALARQSGMPRGLSLAGVGRQTLFWCEDHLRPLLLAAGLIAALACTNYLTSSQQAQDLEDIDSALLTDDLPIDAYLDSGFHSWLAATSQR